MITTKRDNKGTKILINGFGPVTLYSDIVDHEYHRKRIKTPFEEFIGDYYVRNEDAIDDVFKRLIAKHPSIMHHGPIQTR